MPAPGEHVPPGTDVVASVGREDAEHPSRAKGSGPLHLQYLLVRIADRCLARGLVDKFTAEERWADLSRLSDITQTDVSHDWLWSTDPHKGRRIGVMNMPCDSDWGVVGLARR